MGAIAWARAPRQRDTALGFRTGRTSGSLANCWPVSVALLAGALLGTPRAWAVGSTPLVVVVSSSPDMPFVRRLAAELSLFGYRVELAQRSVEDANLGEMLVRWQAAALISVDQRQQTAEVIVRSRDGTSDERGELEALDPRRRADTNAAVLAERFRARLTELGITPIESDFTTRAPLVVPPPPLAPPRDTERRLWAATSIGLSAGGLGVLPEVALELRAFPVSWLSTSAFGKLSLARARVTATEGRADVRLLGGGLLVDAYPVRGDLSVHLGVGALLVDAEISGQASPPWQGQDVSVLVPGALVQAGAAVRLTSRVSAEVRGFVGACSPRVAVRIAEQKVADFGQPFVGATAGIAIGVF